MDHWEAVVRLEPRELVENQHCLLEQQVVVYAAQGVHSAVLGHCEGQGQAAATALVVSRWFAAVVEVDVPSAGAK